MSRNTKPTRQQKSILIVDEDRRLVTELSQHCQSIGLRVRTAFSVIMAMGELDQELPDLVCLDINMPSSNGLSICEMMATDEAAAKIPVIALSERKDDEAIRRSSTMCAYHVNKSVGSWRSMEPVIYELIDIDPPVSKSIGDLA